MRSKYLEFRFMARIMLSLRVADKKRIGVWGMI